MDFEELQAIIQSHTVQLMEHFDTVRILATRHNSDTDVTIPYSCGGGNVFAQMGQAADWLTTEETYTKVEAQGNMDKAQDNMDQE